ncbi:RNA-directed DNA polymerase, eukaryota, reverse transcriptase zinc-binding domain protein [Tanacetum coccineum]
MHHHNGSYIMFGDMNAVRNAQKGTKLSKLDRFLISEDVTIRLPDVRITALDRLWSDHNPILLHIDKTDFGPTPFKLYNSWLLRDGFDNLIKEEWELLDSNLKCHEKIDEGSAMPSDNDHRPHPSSRNLKIDKFASMDIIQKAYCQNGIRWDENSISVTLEEIKEAVWDCGSSKAPGPDGDIPFNYLGLPIGSNMKSIASWM